ncbi:hypothetical protein B0H19DRAFT_1076444 [Mycena capillaripes]|nr:hypothetical protein B0H19DRAFT_1076444 [Mycena capillaripes]
MLLDDTDLECLYIQTLAAGKDEARKLRILYGPVFLVTTPVKIAPPFKSLEISTRAEYDIHSITYYAAKKAACGWRCANGDILRRIFALIKVRTAPLHFCAIKREAVAKDGHLAHVTEMARAACNFSYSYAPIEAEQEPEILREDAALDVLKATADMENNTGTSDEPPSKPFDSGQHKIKKVLASLLPEKTEDISPEGSPTERRTEDDMGRLKDHIHKHFLDSSSGKDNASYVDLLEVPNEDLLYLANRCESPESITLRPAASFAGIMASRPTCMGPFVIAIMMMYCFSALSMCMQRGFLIPHEQIV